MLLRCVLQQLGRAEVSLIRGQPLLDVIRPSRIPVQVVVRGVQNSQGGLYVYHTRIAAHQLVAVEWGGGLLFIVRSHSVKI